MSSNFNPISRSQDKNKAKHCHRAPNQKGPSSQFILARKASLFKNVRSKIQLKKRRSNLMNEGSDNYSSENSDFFSKQFKCVSSYIQESHLGSTPSSESESCVEKSDHVPGPENKSFFIETSFSENKSFSESLAFDEDGGELNLMGVSYNSWWNILESLKSDDLNTQMNGLFDLCNDLSYLTAQEMNSFSLETFLPYISKFLDAVHEPNLMLYSCRSLEYILEIFPTSGLMIYKFDILSKVCVKFPNIEYEELRAQAMKVFKLLCESSYLCTVILRIGGLNSVLSSLEFRDMYLQHQSLDIAIRLVTRIPSDCWDQIVNTIPNLVLLLQNEDKILVEKACECLYYIIYHSRKDQEKLVFLKESLVVENLCRIIGLKTVSMVNSEIGVGVVELAMKCLILLCNFSKSTIGQLFSMNFHHTIAGILMQESGLRFTLDSVEKLDFVFILLNLTAQFLPPPAESKILPFEPNLKFSSSVRTFRFGEPKSCRIKKGNDETDYRLMLYKENPNLLESLADMFLPHLFTLFESRAKYQALVVIVRFIAFLSGDMISSILNNVNFFRLLNDLITSKDFNFLLLGFYIYEQIREKIPDAHFRKFFRENGIVLEIRNLLDTLNSKSDFEFVDLLQMDFNTVVSSNATFNNSVTSTGEEMLFSSKRKSLFESKRGIFHVQGPFKKFLTLDSPALKKIVIEKAEKFISLYGNELEDSGFGRLEYIKNVCTELVEAMGDQHFEKGGKSYKTIQLVADLFSQEFNLTNFEFVNTGLCENLYKFLVPNDDSVSARGGSNEEGVRTFIYQFYRVGDGERIRKLIDMLNYVLNWLDPFEFSLVGMNLSLIPVELAWRYLERSIFLRIDSSSRDDNISSSNVSFDVCARPLTKIGDIKRNIMYRLGKGHQEKSVGSDSESDFFICKESMRGKVVSKTFGSDDTTSNLFNINMNTGSECYQDAGVDDLEDYSKSFGIFDQEKADVMDQFDQSIFIRMDGEDELKDDNAIFSDVTSGELDVDCICLSFSGVELCDDNESIFKVIRNRVFVDSSLSPTQILVSLFDREYNLVYSLKPSSKARGGDCLEGYRGATFVNSEVDSNGEGESLSFHGELLFNPFDQIITGLSKEYSFGVAVDSFVVKILNFLKLLHELNDNLSFFADLGEGKVSKDEFVNSKLSMHFWRQLLDPFSAGADALPSWCKEIVIKFPFLFPIDIRKLYFRFGFGLIRSIHSFYSVMNNGNVDNYLQAVIPKQKITVPRDRLLLAGYTVLDLVKNLKSILEVEYYNELGTGLGPTLEFYALLSQEFQRASLKMWQAERLVKLKTVNSGMGFESTKYSVLVNETHRFWNNSKEKHVSIENGMEDTIYGGGDEYVFNSGGLFPAAIPSEECTKFVLDNYFYLGVFMAKSLLDERLIDLPFSKAFYKKILGKPITICDMEEVYGSLVGPLRSWFEIVRRKKDVEANELLDEKEKAAIVKEIENCNGGSIEDIWLDFVLPGYGELVPGGSSKIITIENLEEYINLVLDVVCNTGVKAQFEAMKAGFECLCPWSNLKVFVETEIGSLFLGSAKNGPWSEEEIMENTLCMHGYTHNSKVVKWMISIMAEFDEEQQREFLQFVTGSPRMPFRGFRGFSHKLTFVRKVPDENYPVDNYFPSVNTCFVYLKIPEYSSKEILKSRLFVAMKQRHQGFLFS